MTADYPAAVAAGTVWVATRDGVVLGLIVLHREPGHLLLENVAVDPAAQGSGIGAALLALAERIGRLWELPEIRLFSKRLG